MFQWPPVLKGTSTIWRDQSVGYLFYHWEANGRLPYVPSSDSYAVPWGRNVVGGDGTRLQGRLSPVLGGVGSAGTVIAYTYDDVTYVQENYNEEFSSLYSVVFYGAAGGSGYSVYGPSVPLTVVPLPASTTQAPDQAWVFQGGSTGIHVFFLGNVEVGASMMVPIYEQRLCHCFYTFATSSFGTATQLFTPEGSMDTYMDVCDAGEGHFYLQYRCGTTVYLRKVDCTTSTPAVSGLLGGSGAGSWIGAGPLSGRNQQDRFVVVGSNRYIFFQTTTNFMRIEFTSGTKGSPAVYLGSVSVPASYCTTVEYDPLDETTRLVVWHANCTSSTHINFLAMWGDPFDSPPTYSTMIELVSVPTHAETSANVIANSQRGHAAAAARLGEAVNSAVVASTSGFLVYPGCCGAAFSFWHTPVEYVREVDARSTYSRGQVTTQITRQRSVDARSTYSRAGVYLAKDGWAGATYHWNVGESTETHIAVDARSTYSRGSVSVELITLYSVDLEQYWTNVGTTWMDDFMVYVNLDRADAGQPPIKTWGSDGLFTDRKDIANLHACNVAWYREFAHEGSVFPLGQRLLPERGAMMNAGATSENLQFTVTYRHSTDTTFAMPTPYEAWENWHDSPGHYANMVYNWGTNIDKAYSLIGVCQGAYPLTAGFEAYADYSCTYLCNNFVLLETLMFEAELEQYWDNDGALIASLPQTWSNSAYAHVERAHTVLYALRVSAEHAVEYGCRVAAQHEVTAHYSVQRQVVATYGDTSPVVQDHAASWTLSGTERVLSEQDHEYALTVAAAFSTNYALLGPVARQHGSGYDIRGTEPVSGAYEAPWALRVSASHEDPYALQATAAQQHGSSYDMRGTEPVAAEQEATYSLRVARQHSSPWVAQSQVGRQHTAPYSSIDPVAQQYASSYHLLAANPVYAANAHYYSLADGVAVIPANNEVAVVLSSGVRIRVDDGVLDSGETEVGYRFECSINSLTDYVLIHEDDEVTIDFCGEMYSLVVKNKSINREDPTAVILRASFNNAVERLDAPYSADISYAQTTAKMASELVADLIEIDFTYQIVDWLVFEGRLQADDNTPLSIVSQIAEAAGGVVDGLPDGTMVLRYPYPYPMNALDAAPTDQVYVDSLDNLSSATTGVYREGLNRFRIREGDASFQDTLEWVPDDPQSDPLYITGTVRAYLSPWRETVAIRHLGGAVYMTPGPSLTEQHEEMVEFSEGEASTNYPVEAISAIEWVSPVLGAVTFQPFSTVINAPTSVERGYGLAKITYTTRHLTARAAGVPVAVPSGEVGPSTAYAYFILEDTHG